jgi:VanZ family protein
MVLSAYLLALLVVSVVPSTGPETGLPIDKAEHFAAYGLASVLFVRHFSRKLKKNVLWCSVCAASAYGLLMEVVQYFVPYRKFSYADAVANTTGAILIGGAWWLWKNRLNPHEQKIREDI